MRGSTQKFGAVCALEFVATRTLLAASCWVTPVLGRHGAVHVDGQRRRVRHLKHMRIHDARDLHQRARDLGRQRKGGVLIRPGNSHVDGRRLAEIQHLIDDVGGLEEELQLGEARGQLRRSIAISCAVGVCFSFSEIRISPSIGPTVAESLNAMLMPL